MGKGTKMRLEDAGSQREMINRKDGKFLLEVPSTWNLFFSSKPEASCLYSFYKARLTNPPPPAFDIICRETSFPKKRILKSVQTEILAGFKYILLEIQGIKWMDRWTDTISLNQTRI